MLAMAESIKEVSFCPRSFQLFGDLVVAFFSIHGCHRRRSLSIQPQLQLVHSFVILLLGVCKLRRAYQWLGRKCSLFQR